MSARQSHWPLSPLSSNLTGTKTADTSKRDRDDEDLSIVSGLTSLENDDDAAADDFDRLMLQNARDERRLRDALRGTAQPFRNARTHPRVGLTMENLERHSGYRSGVGGVKGPSSSSGGSDPAVQPPLEWGRKARVRKNWLRTITADAGRGQEMQAEEWAQDLGEATPRPADLEDIPRQSVEDSPLSHKSFQRGTPTHSRRRALDVEQEPDFDFTMDFNEASMIASTPYIPRNPTLDDIRRREIDSLEEQAETTNQRVEVGEDLPEEAPHPRPPITEPTWRTQSAARGEVGRSHSPALAVRKSSRMANIESQTPKPSTGREDSHNLLRRLARASSNTPSPGRVSGQGVPPAPGATESTPSTKRVEQLEQPLNEDSAISKGLVLQSTQGESGGPAPSEEQAPINAVETTPAPVAMSRRYAKTPVVTGAWIDTPGPRTVRRSAGEPLQPHVRSPEKGSPSKKSPQKGRGTREEEPPKQPPAPIEVARPTLPSSALQALVKGVKGKGKDKAAEEDEEMGDSTLDSLEDLIELDGEEHTGDLDEDTLQGLQLPTEPPKNEAERQRQKELAQLHKMNQRLRAARTSIRDASRGMRRVEHQVEHIEVEGEKNKVTLHGHSHCNPWETTWIGFKRLFYRPEHPRRHGLTWLSIALISFWIWFISENLACERYCHKLYASEMVGYGVVWDAPRYPYVLPTLLWRNLLRPVGAPIWNLLAWLYEDETVKAQATATARSAATRIFKQTYTGETFEPDLSMGDDEII